MNAFASREHPTSDVPISFQQKLGTGALWVTIFVAMCVRLPKFDQVLGFLMFVLIFAPVLFATTMLLVYVVLSQPWLQKPVPGLLLDGLCSK